MSQIEDRGSLVITLDYEKIWGVFDFESYDSFKEKAQKVDDVVHRLIKLADDYQVKLTFNTVGFLFAEDFSDLKKYQAEVKPKYEDKQLNAYDFAKVNEQCSDDDVVFFSHKTIEKISKSGHELGTHTHSHFYCKENGQDIDSFKSDISAARKIASEKFGADMRSIVFPRNQVNSDYLNECSNQGIKVYRGVENSFIYKERSGSTHNPLVRIIRLIDAYVNISGHHTQSVEIHQNGMINIRSSRFFRPYSHNLRFLEPLKLRRIKKAMTAAAKQNKIYHLWFHPHNFSSNSDQNFEQLESVFKHFSLLEEKYSFSSMRLDSFINGDR